MAREKQYFRCGRMWSSHVLLHEGVRKLYRDSSTFSQSSGCRAFRELIVRFPPGFLFFRKEKPGATPVEDNLAFEAFATGFKSLRGPSEVFFI